MARGRGRRGGGRGRGRGGGRGGGGDDDDSDVEVQPSMGTSGNWCDQPTLLASPVNTHCYIIGQNSNVGMLPPSDSDEDSEYEKVPVKAKEAVTTQVCSSPVCTYSLCLLASATSFCRSLLLLACYLLVTLRKSPAPRRKKRASLSHLQLANPHALLLRLLPRSMFFIFVRHQMCIAWHIGADTIRNSTFQLTKITESRCVKACCRVCFAYMMAELLQPHPRVNTILAAFAVNHRLKNLLQKGR